MAWSQDIPAIVLAGGFGTRLRHVLPDVPKPMAPISDKPFLAFVLDYLIEQGIQRVILATGHKADIIREYFGSQYKSLEILYSHESEPLGTGGAIKQAFDRFQIDKAFIINGDTYFPIDLSHLLYFHDQFDSQCTIAVKYLKDFSRYGTIRFDAYNRIKGFDEKKSMQEGWINGGIYLIDKSIFHNIEARTFSFEKEILEAHYTANQFYAIPSPAYFVDIGIPTDYYRFEKEHGRIPGVEIFSCDTLFIDRDGVINTRIPGDYVRRSEDFTFEPGAIAALESLSSQFNRLIVVTNQQGIGKALMSREDLDSIHEHMRQVLADRDVRLDAVYYCPDIEADNPPDRKPRIGMARRAKDAFEELDWSRCAMIGDSTTDIEFGLRAGMQTVLVGQKSATSLFHYRFPDLKGLADWMSAQQS